MKAPKHTQKYVVWHNDENGHLLLLVGYCPDTLGYYKALFKEAEKSVPDLNEDDAICTKVTNSTNVKNFTLLLIPIKGPKREIPDFPERDSFEQIGVLNY